jgi:hypothetical protein
MIDLEFILSEKRVAAEIQQDEWATKLCENMSLNEAYQFILGLMRSRKIIVMMNKKNPKIALEKLFLRGKPLDDLARCMVLNGHQDFLRELENFTAQQKFSLWIEDDRDKEKHWATYKIYLYKNNKSYYGRIVPLEIQLISMKIYHYSKESSDHRQHEESRKKDYNHCKEVYKKYKIFEKDIEKLMLHLNLKGMLECLLL